MEDDTWSFGFSASSRSYQSTLKSQSADRCNDFEEIEEDDELKTEYPCPYCSEDFDLLGLCCHIDEEHHLEANYGVCPVCTLRVGMNMVDHITTQHGNPFKSNHKLKFCKGDSYSTLSLRKELHDAHYQSLLARSWSSLSSSNTAPDPVLSFLSYVPPAYSSESVKSASSTEATLEEKGSDVNMLENLPVDRDVQPPPLSDKEHLEKAKRCEFVQGLLLSTIFDGAL
ncbi:PREDICTED: protein DEHYDRATION-INDUCED 19 homolog 4 isoform X1 [Theobroma cacao]|uniref:Protein DEHYDRATION-INDUCED 19 homolog 4 isoform X1 n=1 Tax=Theobroma cacao TaxID=3641 RepID=A0AB32WQX5_THECC|nr:PREDICTED: protein DEHYDRATION-INDUCED 19 homolog 4 isoform X1 [Theobroma cacao]